MTYDEAKTICNAHAPQLFVGPQTGMNHLNVYSAEGKGTPFSIQLQMLRPDSHDTPEDAAASEKKMFLDALDAAVRCFA